MPHVKTTSDLLSAHATSATPWMPMGTLVMITTSVPTMLPTIAAFLLYATISRALMSAIAPTACKTMCKSLAEALFGIASTLTSAPVTSILAMTKLLVPTPTVATSVPATQDTGATVIGRARNVPILTNAATKPMNVTNSLPARTLLVATFASVAPVTAATAANVSTLTNV